MIGALSGKVLVIKTDYIVLMVNGVGYKVFMPANDLSRIQRDDLLLLFTYTHVREDILGLFGFMKQEELGLFELLLSVSGIGPKTALNITSHGASQVRQAVHEADVRFFTSIPRLGNKNAQKIIIELKSKIGSSKDLDLTGDEQLKQQEIIEVLISMGFTNAEAIRAVKELPSHIITLEAKIKFAIQFLGNSHV